MDFSEILMEFEMHNYILLGLLRQLALLDKVTDVIIILLYVIWIIMIDLDNYDCKIVKLDEIIRRLWVSDPW